MMEFCQWLQATPWSTWLQESTWSYPILAAVHVLGLAWFGGAVLKNLPAGKRLGLAFMTLTGMVLFYLAPVHCYQSYAFRIKMLLLVAAVAQSSLRSGRGQTTLSHPANEPAALQSGSGQSGLSPSASQAGTPTVSYFCWIGMIFAARGIAFF
jgi:hypothetical protein